VLRKRRGLLLTTLGLILFIVYLAFSNPFKVLLGVGRFNFGLFLLSVLINYLGLVLFAVSWYILLRGGKAIASVLVHKAMYNISFGFLIALAATIITTFYGASIPIRGDLLWFVILFSVGSSLLFAAILDQRLLRLIYRHSPSWIRSRLFDRLCNQKLGLNNFDAVIDEIGKAVKALKSRIGLNFLALMGIAFHWSTGSLTAYLAALSLGLQINFWFIVVVYAIVEFIQQLNVIIPGGLGIVDAGLTGAFVLMGIPLSVASAISLLTRLATYWLEFVLAGFVSIHYGYKESLKEYLGNI